VCMSTMRPKLELPTTVTEALDLYLKLIAHFEREI